MTVYEWVAVSLAVFYGGVSAWSGVMQLNRKMIPLWSAVGMMFSGIFLAASTIIDGDNPYMFIFVITPLLLLHALAIRNGFHLYGQLHLRHHMVRLLLSCIIVIFLIV